MLPAAHNSFGYLLICISITFVVITGRLCKLWFSLCKKKKQEQESFWWVIQNPRTFVTTTINHRNASLNCNFEKSVPSVLFLLVRVLRLEIREFSICEKLVFCSSSSQSHETPLRFFDFHSFQLVLFRKYILLLLLQIMRMLLSLRISVHFLFVSFFFLYCSLCLPMLWNLHMAAPPLHEYLCCVEFLSSFQEIAARYERVFMAKKLRPFALLCIWQQRKSERKLRSVSMTFFGLKKTRNNKFLSKNKKIWIFLTFRKITIWPLSSFFTITISFSRSRSATKNLRNPKNISNRSNLGEWMIAWHFWNFFFLLFQSFWRIASVDKIV